MMYELPLALVADIILVCQIFLEPVLKKTDLLCPVTVAKLLHNWTKLSKTLQLGNRSICCSLSKILVLCLLYQTHYLKANTPLTSLDDCQYIAPLSNVEVYENLCCRTLFGHAIILFWTCPNSCTFSKEGREIKKEKRRRNTVAENSKGKR